MFNRETWRREISHRLAGFTRNPRQELQLAGVPSLLGYLVVRTLEPFLDIFHQQPIAAILALAEITRGPGADKIVQRVIRVRYLSVAQLDRELRTNQDIRQAAEQLLIELQTIPLARQKLNSAREVWLRSTLERELDLFPNEFVQLRRILHDQSWQPRYEALRELRHRAGTYTPADLVLIHDGLQDSAAHVRAAAARALGLIVEPPPLLLTQTLIRLALHDSDAETRYAATRSIGLLREHITSPQLLDHLRSCLHDGDSFVRSATALVLGQLGDLASTSTIIKSLIKLLDDADVYTCEAAARALGQLGSAAATSEVLDALTRTAQSGDLNVHEAAIDSIAGLRDLRAGVVSIAASA
ncbi:MAG: HEAT repeat domain-containing protein [Chloroflexota bacterium]